jgi:protein-tyrosine-phosphatase
MDAKKQVLFVCFGNANRSQLAEAFARIHGGDRIDAYSAGVAAAASIDDRAIAAMADRGYDLSTHRPKNLNDVPQVNYDAVVTMGCEEKCPSIPAATHIAWELPQGKTAGEYAALCSEIEDRVKALIARLSDERV